MIGNLITINPVALTIAFDRCNVRLGDFVTPRTVVGSAVKGDELVQAGCYGTVTGVQFRGGSPQMTIIVQPESRLIT